MRTDVIALDAELKKRSIIKERLLELCPELADDDEALMDTLDGENNAKEILVAMARASREREAYVKTCKELAKVYSERAARHDAAKEALRKAIIWGMEQLGETKLKHALTSISVSAMEDKIEIIAKDVEMVPDDYLSEKITKYVDMEKVELHLQEAIEDGVAIIVNDRKKVTIRI